MIPSDRIIHLEDTEGIVHRYKACMPLRIQGDFIYIEPECDAGERMMKTLDFEDIMKFTLQPVSCMLCLTEMRKRGIPT